MQLSTDIFNEVVYYLDHHKESLRIKKLIFCICKKYWENDLTILNNVSLTELVQELIKLKPSNDHLSFSVYKLVKTLNRSTVYDPLARVIIEQINRLYNSQLSQASNNEQEEDTQLITNQLKSSSLHPNYQLIIEQVVANLANHQEEGRIKKLIFAASKNHWENNINLINEYGLKNLILDLRNTHANQASLRESFNHIVNNINKKNLYSGLANLIVNQIEMLYDTEVDYEENNKLETNIIETQIIHLDKSQINSPEIPQTYSLKQQGGRNQEFATSIIDLEKPQYLNQIKLPVPPLVEPQPKPYNYFELRLEIMQYTNPLRAKILLFSLLFQPWDYRAQDWTTLKGYTLEDLLDQLIQSRRSIKEIETKLYNIAKSQPDVESNLQTANVIIQAIGQIL